MPSDIDICNLALTKLGAMRILSFADNTKAARSLNAIYALERDNELSAHQWNFAIVRTTLPALANAPAFDYTLAYQLPDDCLRVIQVGDTAPGSTRTDYLTEDGADYRIEGKTIVTGGVTAAGASPLPLRYIARITDPNMFDAGFIKAFACRLAMEMAEDLTQSSSKRQLAQGEYKEAILSAIRADSIELPPEPLPDNTWVLSRLPS